MTSVLQRAFDMGIQSIRISYDISCKYSVNFYKRVTQGTVKLLTTPLDVLISSITWFVPKFHLTGHQESCSKRYNFNYTWGVGRSHGEQVETVWAELNWLKYQTKEMTPGGRQDTLTDNMNHWNWTKVVNMGVFSK